MLKFKWFTFSFFNFITRNMANGHMTQKDSRLLFVLLPLKADLNYK